MSRYPLAVEEEVGVGGRGGFQVKGKHAHGKLGQQPLLWLLQGLEGGVWATQKVRTQAPLAVLALGS